MTTQWLRQRACGGPLEFNKSDPKGTLTDSDLVRPLSDREHLSSVRHVMIGPSVVHLLSLQGPSAITRRIWTVVVDAVNRMSWRRTRPNISIKSLERGLPSLVHHDPASSVVFVSLDVRVIAARFCVSPRTIFRRAFVAMDSSGVPVGAHAGGMNIAGIAAARLGALLSQMVQAHFAFISAIASAQNSALLATLCGECHDNQSSETLPRRDRNRTHVSRYFTAVVAA